MKIWVFKQLVVATPYDCAIAPHTSCWRVTLQMQYVFKDRCSTLMQHLTPRRKYGPWLEVCDECCQFDHSCLVSPQKIVRCRLTFSKQQKYHKPAEGFEIIRSQNTQGTTEIENERFKEIRIARIGAGKWRDKIEQADRFFDCSLPSNAYNMSIDCRGEFLIANWILFILFEALRRQFILGRTRGSGLNNTQYIKLSLWLRTEPDLTAQWGPRGCCHL